MNILYGFSPDLRSYDPGSEGKQREFYEMKIFDTKRNAYYGHAQRCSNYKWIYGKRNADEYYPQHIQKKADCPHVQNYFSSERKEHVLGYLKKLYSNRDAYYSDAE